jgi:hypothetical protein
MKLMSIINERDHQNEEDDLSPEQLKELRKGKTIFKALKKGSLSFKSEERGGEFLLTYEVKGPYWYWEWSAGEKVFRVEFNHIEVHTTDPNLYQDFISNNLEKGWKITTRSYLEDHIVNFYVRKKFKNLGVDVRDIDHIKLVLDEPQSINEDISSDDKKEKLIKRAKTIYKGLKTGVLGNAMFGKVHYILPDEFDVKIDIHDETFIEVGNNQNENKVKLYYVNDNSGDVKEYNLNNADYRDFIIFLRKKFDPFGIFLWYDEKYENETLNEDNTSMDDDRLRKKVITVNKALRKGTFTIEYDHNEVKTDTKYRYELPKMCTPYFLGKRLSIKYLYNGKKTDTIGDRYPLKIWKVEDGKDILLNNHITNHDYDYIEDNLENTMFSYIFVKVMDHVKKRYDNFGIFLDLNLYNEIHPLNESFKIKNERNVNQEELDKSIKKLKVIYKALKNGKITINDDDGPEKKYRYVLNDIYKLIVNNEAGTRMIITPEGLVENGAKFKLYEIQPNGEEVFIEKDKNLNGFLYTKIWNKIVVRFYKYDDKVALR